MAGEGKAGDWMGFVKDWSRRRRRRREEEIEIEVMETQSSEGQVEGKVKAGHFFPLWR